MGPDLPGPFFNLRQKPLNFFPINPATMVGAQEPEEVKPRQADPGGGRIKRPQVLVQPASRNLVADLGAVKIDHMERVGLTVPQKVTEIAVPMVEAGAVHARNGIRHQTDQMALQLQIRRVREPPEFDSIRDELSLQFLGNLGIHRLFLLNLV